MHRTLTIVLSGSSRLYLMDIFSNTEPSPKAGLSFMNTLIAGRTLARDVMRASMWRIQCRVTAQRRTKKCIDINQSFWLVGRHVGLLVVVLNYFLEVPDSQSPSFGASLPFENETAGSTREATCTPTLSL